MHKCGLSIWLSVAGIWLVTAAHAITPPGHAPAPNFDRRRAAAPAAVPEEIPATARAAADTVRNRVRETRVEHDRVTGAPRFVASTRGFLTGPARRGARGEKAECARRSRRTIGIAR